MEIGRSDACRNVVAESSRSNKKTPRHSSLLDSFAGEDLDPELAALVAALEDGGENKNTVPDPRLTETATVRVRAIDDARNQLPKRSIKFKVRMVRCLTR